MTTTIETPSALRRLALLAGLLAASGAMAQATPAGLWKSVDDNTHKERSLVRISDSGGVYSGRIEKLLDPATPQDKLCDKCSDDRKDKPVLGMEVIRGARKSADTELQWDGGTILDPSSGKSYKLRMTLSDDGRQLQVRGYIGTPVLGRSQVWARVE